MDGSTGGLAVTARSAFCSLSAVTKNAYSLAGRSTRSPGATDRTTRVLAFLEALRQCRLRRGHPWPGTHPEQDIPLGREAQRGITAARQKGAQVSENDDGVIIDYNVELALPPTAPSWPRLSSESAAVSAAHQARSPPTAVTASPPSNVTCAIWAYAP